MEVGDMTHGGNSMMHKSVSAIDARAKGKEAMIVNNSQDASRTPQGETLEVKECPGGQEAEEHHDRNCGERENPCLARCETDELHANHVSGEQSLVHAAERRIEGEGASCERWTP